MNKAPISNLAILGLIRDKNGDPTSCAANVATMLATHPDLEGATYYDSFRATEMLTRPFVAAKGPFPRPLQDHDLTDLQGWLDRAGLEFVSTQRAAEAVSYVARKAAVDPLVDHIEALPEWDGAERLDTAPQIYLGAIESELHSAFFRCFLIGMVARALSGGCKMDTCLVLEGRQGVGKSTALSILGGPFFTDVLPSFGSKDAQHGLRGQWLVELAELSQLRTSAAAFKGFLSRQVETYRPAYGRKAVIEHRRCVFAGTTNDSAWLTDPTGGRRFWPIKCEAIDLISLADDRDQILAEALSLFKAGESWTLPHKLWEAASDHVGDRQAVDPWTETIEAFLVGKTSVTLNALLGQVLGSISDRTPAQAQRVGGILTVLGWETTRIKIDGKRQRAWRKS